LNTAIRSTQTAKKIFFEYYWHFAT